VVQRAMAFGGVGGVGELPACGIRERCRWFAQEGSAACAVCPLVRTDNTSSLAPLEFAQ
jgi:hypothetical protein